MANSDLFEHAAAELRKAHDEDPRQVAVGGRTLTWSSHYHDRLAHWVDHFAPQASEALRLAARCQHIRRWTIPRSSYEEGRTGYKRWRSNLARFHAEQSAKILRDVGYDEETIARVGAIQTKQRLKQDPEVQAMEDAICLVFIENELEDFAGKHEHRKLVDVVRKTWAKMSPAGHNTALELAKHLPKHLHLVLGDAIVDPDPTPDEEPAAEI
jgi:hypothetical protein